jgi:hypothetical protein
MKQPAGSIITSAGSLRRLFTTSLALSMLTAPCGGDVEGLFSLAAEDAVSEFIEPPEESRLVANPCTGYGYRQFIDTIEDPFLTFGCS